MLATHAERGGSEAEIGRLVGVLGVLVAVLFGPPPALLLGAGIWMA